MSETNIIIFSLLGGIIPALFWLWFWIRTDRLHPEPKSAILSAFIGGILAVFFALFLELIIYYLFVEANSYHLIDFPFFLQSTLENVTAKYNLINFQQNIIGQIETMISSWNIQSLNNLNIKISLLVVVIAPIIEESLKFLLTYNICLRRKINDEPIDASIYMLTSALGFAAIETTIFLTNTLTTNSILDGLITINFRSIGPMLIHLVSSATLGIFIGLAFYKNKIKKILYFTIGLILAIGLHSLFNLFIILNETTHNKTYFWTACTGTWILMIILLFVLKRIKGIKRHNSVSLEK